jgi:hypothetical protein
MPVFDEELKPSPTRLRSIRIARHCLSPRVSNARWHFCGVGPPM